MTAPAKWTFVSRKRFGRKPEWTARCVGANGEPIARLNQWYSRRIDAAYAVGLAQNAKHDYVTTVGPGARP